eukprot:scaffold14827_cov586-Ochromonas_danica.AAC.1
MLLDPRVDINLATKEGWSPIHLACRIGHVEVVKALQSDGRVDVNKANEPALTSPLAVACGYGHLEVVKILKADYRVETDERFE